MFDRLCLDDVEVNYCGCGAWYPAKISDILYEPLRYIVNYEDGSIVEETDASIIRKLLGQERNPGTNLQTFDCSSAVSVKHDKTTTSYFVNSDETASILPRYEILGSLGSLLLQQALVEPAFIPEGKNRILTEASAILSEASNLAMNEGKTKIAMKYLKDSAAADIK